MLQRKYFVISSVVTYVFLIMLFYMVQDRKSFLSACSYNETCIRFCCYDKSLCKESLIRETFNASILAVDRIEDGFDTTEIKKNFKILLGSPTCKLVKQTSSNTSKESWSINVSFTKSFFCVFDFKVQFSVWRICKT